MKSTPFIAIFLSFILISSSVLTAYPQTIITAIGTGIAGASGDEGPATAAEINGVWGAAIDGAGNMYIGDRFNNQIRKISPVGIITTIAGTGASGFGGDGGPATAALLYQPAGVAVDTAGNVYITDCLNQCIRKISLSGIISTVVGIGTTGGYSGDGGSATLALIDHPGGICIDKQGNMYFADMTNNCIRKVNQSGIISTFAGNGVPGFSGDGGPATSAELFTPNDISVDGLGNVYVSDFYNNRIRKVDTSGVITTIMGAGTGGYSGDGIPATACELMGPGGISFDVSGNIYVSCADNHRVRRIDSAGIVTTISGNSIAGYSGDGGPATAAELNRPCHLLFDITGDLYITDGSENRVREIVNRAPSFTGGDSQTFTVCENTALDSLNSLLSVIDSDVEQKETWSLLSAPAHGSAAIGGYMISTGDVLHPTGLSYTPTASYIGDDSFVVRITDGYLSDTTVIHVIVAPCALEANSVFKSENKKINVYPNPTTSSLTITFSVPMTSIIINNVLGEVVREQKCNTEIAQIAIADLPPGVYLVKINGTEVRKFIKQ